MMKNLIFFVSLLILTPFFYANAYTCGKEKCENKCLNSPKEGDRVYTQTICPAGKYVSKCGKFATGTNWLKGASVDKNECTGDNCTDCCVTTDWTPGTAIENMNKLTSLFSNQYQKTQPEENLLNLIFSYFCNPTDPDVIFECERCPNGKNVLESKIMYNVETKKIYREASAFHTIADCYIENEFFDITGTYKYVNINNDQECYYSNEETGDLLNIN